MLYEPDRHSTMSEPDEELKRPGKGIAFTCSQDYKWNTCGEGSSDDFFYIP